MMAVRRRSNWNKPIWDRECYAYSGCLSGGRLARCPGQRDGERGPVLLNTLHGELSGGICVKNISKGVVAAPDLRASTGALHEPSELALRDAVEAHTPRVTMPAVVTR